MSERLRADVHLPGETIEAIAERATQIAAERIAATSEPSKYATVEEAASYLRCSKQRVHDLLSARRLRRFKDGSRPLVLRAELEQYVEEVE